MKVTAPMALSPLEAFIAEPANLSNPKCPATGVYSTFPSMKAEVLIGIERDYNTCARCVNKNVE